MSCCERGTGAMEGPSTHGTWRSGRDPAIVAAPTLRGRDRELAAIGDCLGRLRAGSGSVILIEAPSGHGQEPLDRRERADREPFVAGGGGERGGARGGRGRARADVARAVRWSGTDPQPLAARGSTGRGRGPLLDARGSQASLERAALDAPMLVWLDDLQWADAGTVAALRLLPDVWPPNRSCGCSPPAPTSHPPRYGGRSISWRPRVRSGSSWSRWRRRRSSS